MPLSAPAFAGVGNINGIIISSVESAHEPLSCHRKVVAEPAFKPDTPEAGAAGVVIVAVPETTDHNPVPMTGTFPASVVVVILHIT